MVCPLAIVDIRKKADANPDAQVTPDDLKTWVAANGPIPQGACVARNAGWQSRLGTPGFRNVDADGTMHFPAFHVEAAKMLLEDTEAVGVAVDMLSINYGLSADFITHYTWLPENRWGGSRTWPISINFQPPAQLWSWVRPNTKATPADPAD